MASKYMTPERERELEGQALDCLFKATKALKDAGVVLRAEGGNIDIARIGHWVWAEGEELKTLPAIRGLLKGLGFRYNGKRQAWGWSPYKYRGKRSPLELAQLAQKYGYQTV